MTSKRPDAALVIIGNEILSGRTQDTNLNYLAKTLVGIGVRFAEARVVADIEDEIVIAVNELRQKYDYVFTSGGIGPTHDDITAAAIAKAFAVKLEFSEEAASRMIKRYEKPSDFNDARKKMATIPKGANLIDNPISAAPGFAIENVYVMAGVPDIFRAMVDGVKSQLKGGKPVISVSVGINLREGHIAEGLGRIQNGHPEVEIGSYPHIKGNKLGVSLVTRGEDIKQINKVVDEIKSLVSSLGGEVVKD